MNPGEQNDFYGDMRPLVESDLDAFVRETDRHRSLTVVREDGDVDGIGEAKRWVEKLRADAGDTDACTAMRTVIERWADGSRHAQFNGVLGVVRMDERGHVGVAAALDELWSVRAKSPRDFRRMMEFARHLVSARPSPPDAMGCSCPDQLALSKIPRTRVEDVLAAEQAGDVEEDEVVVDAALQRKVDDLLLSRQAKRIADAIERPPTAPPSSVSLRELLARPREAAKYRIDQMWPAGGKVLITAPKKSGKTTLVGNLIRSLVDGDGFLSRPAHAADWKVQAAGYRVTVSDRVVMLLDFEMTESMLVEWLADQRIAALDSVHVELMRGRTWDIRDDDIRRQWATYLHEQNVGTLIVDPIGPVIHGLGIEENSNSEVGCFLAALDRLANEAGIDEYAAVHHAGHGVDQRARGASAFLGWPDATWQITRSEQGSFLSAEGRDVQLPETALVFDRTTRRLSLGEGNRAVLRETQHGRAVLDAVTGTPGVVKSKLELAVRKATKTGAKPARDAIDAAVVADLIHFHDAVGRAIPYFPGASCARCEVHRTVRLDPTV